MIKQIWGAIVGPDGKMEMKELVTVNLLIMVWVMIISYIWKGVVWNDTWILAIPLSLIGSVFGTIYQKLNTKNESNNISDNRDIGS